MGFFLGDVHVHTHVVSEVTNSSQFAQDCSSFSTISFLFQSPQSLANLEAGYLSDHPITPCCFNDCLHHPGRCQKRAKEIQFSGSCQCHQNWGWGGALHVGGREYS